MTTYPAALTAHTAEPVTTLCRCWRLTRVDGSVAGYTDHDASLEVDGLTFEPQSGFTASEAKQTLGLTADAMEVEGALSSASISEDDIEAGALDGATVETLLVNWRSPAQFARIGLSMVGKIVRRDGAFVAELESRMRFLDQPHGRFVLRQCDAELGDARCRVALTSFGGAGSVTSVDATDTCVVSGLAGFADGWFSGGVVTFAGGTAVGQPLRVAHHQRRDGVVSLGLVIDGAAKPQAGDAFTVTAGCDKSFATCKAKFANGVNFQGFPHLPGNDRAYAFAKEGGVFDGGAIVR